MLKNKHNQHHLLQKLYNREVWSSFSPRRMSAHNRAKQLFKKIPERLMFYLRDILQHIGNHVLMGTTQCGQFLITYSFRTEQQTLFKYRLHWWAFRPGAPAYKVAEVQLFDNFEIRAALSIGIAQWPNVNNRLVAYGHWQDISDVIEDEDYSETRMCYITVTTLPSLHNCKECRLIAASFDEEEMAANWDSSIGLSCLKHCYTVHTSFEVEPPYPPFNVKISLKTANSIIINTGNFLHVLNIDLESPNSKSKTECDNIVPAEIKHRLVEPLNRAGLHFTTPWYIDHRSMYSSDTASESGSDVTEDPRFSEPTLCLDSCKPMWTKRIPKLAPKPPTKKTMDWLSQITDQAEKAYAFNDLDDGCEPKFKWYRRRRLADKMYEFCSEDEDMENIQPSQKMSRLRSTPTLRKECSQRESFCEQIASSRVTDSCDDDNNRPTDIVEKDRVQHISNKDCVQISSSEFEIVDIKPPVKTNCEEKDVKCSSYHVLECQEKTDDSNVLNNIQALSQIVISPIANKLDKVSSKVCDEVSLPDEVPSCIPAREVPNVFTELSLKTDDRAINPDLKAIIADWEADSLSPKSESVSGKTKESKYDVIQRFLELLPGTSSKSSLAKYKKNQCKVNTQDNLCAQETEDCDRQPTSKFSPLRVALRPHNHNKSIESVKQKQDVQDEVIKPVPKDKVKIPKELSNGRQMIHGCSVQFDRRFIEEDGEIISITTDIEDDDPGTGYHCALPLSVHGSFYSQMQMIRNYKAGKLNVPCGLVQQTTLDIEQVCSKAADIICQCEGYKFWFCSDYDVQIIDVCPLNGDILTLVCMRVNAEVKLPRLGKRSYLWRFIDRREFYVSKCLVVWNPERDQCWLEVYSPLISGPLPSARTEANKIKSKLPSDSMFTLPLYPPMRFYNHKMWTGNSVLVASLEAIRDHLNLIGFRFREFPVRSRRSRSLTAEHNS